MATIDYILTLTSDAEPGSGFGTELINDLIPIDCFRKPIINGSQIKGIMRENCMTIATDLCNESLKKSIETVFGMPYGAKSDNTGLIAVTDATTNDDPCVFTVTRTRLTEQGPAMESSLRTTEALAVGTKFKGHVYISDEADQCVTLLVHWALLSIDAIGGNRTRGSGACFVELQSYSLSVKETTPGALLRRLLQELAVSPIKQKTLKSSPVVQQKTHSSVYLKLTFIAQSPVCVPEIPVLENNSIRTGFTISASAVQGMILHRLNQYDPSLAEACFMSDSWRPWPLLPTTEEKCLPVRLPATHRMSKFPDEQGNYSFDDEFVCACESKTSVLTTRLKTIDGVLIPSFDNVKVWNSNDMSRVITAHSVINGITKDNTIGHNFFTVESMAPLIFSGIVSMPENAAIVFEQSISKNKCVHFGKARSVRGSGELRIERISIDCVLQNKHLNPLFHQRIYVTQSPLLVPDDWEINTVSEVIKQLVSIAGWGTVQKAQGSISVLFGWNRHGKGIQCNKGGRLRAQRIVQPGSVFVLEQPLAKEHEKLLQGIGSGKLQGFGALLPHPGIATERYIPNRSEPTAIKSRSQAGTIGFEFFNKAKKSGLTSSQISYMRSKLNEGKDIGLPFLQAIKNSRTTRTYDRWKDVIEHLCSTVETDYDTTLDAIKVWHDLSVAQGDSHE